MALLLSIAEQNEELHTALKAELPNMAIKIYPNVGEPSCIEYAILWKHPFGDLQRYPNLKAILSYAAGVDHIIADPQLPKVPIVRLEDATLSQDMCLHALYWVLYFHNNYYFYKRQQCNKKWLAKKFISPKKRLIGVMGIGNIGSKIATALQQQGFSVLGFSANKHKTNVNLASMHGNAQMQRFLSQLDILINVLPLTEKTTNLLNRKNLKQLPQGAFLINMGRGGVVNEDDLLALLDEGHLSAAALDVFAKEPLATNSKLWSHPCVYITPHIAGKNNPISVAKKMANNIKRIQRGEVAFPLYDYKKGY